MTRFAAALSRHPVPAHAVGEVAGQLLEGLEGEDPDLLVCFASPDSVGAFEDMVDTLHQLVDPHVLIGGSAVAIVGGAHEVETGPAFSAWAAQLPETTCTPVGLTVVDTPDGPSVAGWPDGAADAHTLVLFADPFSFPIDSFLARVNADLPLVTVIGGLASAGNQPGTNRIALGRDVVAEGAVGVLLTGGAPVRTVVSQGCRPVGQPLVVTDAERNFVRTLAGRPALERIQELAGSASEEDRALMQRGLHVGIVVDEHKAEFGRGDFLVRNVLGADRDNGAVAVGDRVEIGQTVQFHVRDAAAADEDLRELLAGERAAGALLFTCNGRGTHFFGVADHDAELINRLLGPLPLAGAFCAGELGPVGGRNFLHGFTASLALFDG